jgi:hypothetical protein
MPARSSGEAVPSVAEAADNSWWTFKYYNPGSASDPRLAYIAGYRRAYKDALADSAEFAGLPDQIRRLTELLEEQRIEREALLVVAEETRP